jgi:hypothetical protein
MIKSPVGTDKATATSLEDIQIATSVPKSVAGA